MPMIHIIGARTRTRRRVPASPRGRMRGISLIEVLVSVVVIAIGLLGIAAMQSVALRGSQSSLESSQAVMQTNAILEAMRANRRNAANYVTAMTCAVPTATGTLAQRDLNNWFTSLKSSIVGPAAVAADTTVCASIAGCPDACVITVRWNDTRAGGNATRNFVTRTTI